MSTTLDHKPGGPLEIEHDEKSVKGEAVVSGDYSGAAEKTDPVEIALVRKLDRRIMVSLISQLSDDLALTFCKPILWAMYFLNYVCRSSCAVPLGRSANIRPNSSTEMPCPKLV